MSQTTATTKKPAPLWAWIILSKISFLIFDRNTDCFKEFFNPLVTKTCTKFADFRTKSFHRRKCAYFFLWCIVINCRIKPMEVEIRPSLKSILLLLYYTDAYMLLDGSVKTYGIWTILPLYSAISLQCSDFAITLMPNSPSEFCSSKSIS